jgi:hypothetical protein
VTLRYVIEARAGGEVGRRLRTPVQRDEQRGALEAAVRYEEPVVYRYFTSGTMFAALGDNG